MVEVAVIISAPEERIAFVGAVTGNRDAGIALAFGVLTTSDGGRAFVGAGTRNGSTYDALTDGVGDVPATDDGIASVSTGDW